MDVDEDEFIPFIHNYCDRWCERCEFVTRCRVGVAEAQLTEAEKDPSGEAFVRTLQNIFDDAGRMLEEKAAEFGIEIDTTPDPEYEARSRERRRQVRSDEMSRLSTRYAMRSRELLGAQAERFAALAQEDPLIDEMVEILGWYMFFISVKLQRALNGLLREPFDDDYDALTDTQSDANGSAKIALIAIERSILAWTYVMPPEGSADIRSLIEMLEATRSMAEAKFPYARDFIRPGFDEIGMVM